MRKNKGLQRRSFLKLTATGAAGSLIIPNLKAETVTKTLKHVNPPKKFVYRTLGKTGIKVDQTQDDQVRNKENK